jgi:NADP-dependent 3-hydroxy acid dehydrogenase YdfG
MQDFEGRVAVITGAASGIGWGMAQAFADAGMKLVMADIETPTLEAAGAELRAAGHEVITVQTDVADPDIRAATGRRRS